MTASTEEIQQTNKQLDRGIFDLEQGIKAAIIEINERLAAHPDDKERAHLESARREYSEARIYLDTVLMHTQDAGFILRLIKEAA